jgi:hypothetical protein
MSDRFYVVKHVPATIVPVLITAIRELEAERDEANKRAAMQTVSSMGQAWDRITAEAKVARLEGEVTALEWFAEISAAQAVATKHKVDALTKGEPMTDMIDRAEKLAADCELAARVMAETGTFETGQAILKDCAAFIRALPPVPAPDAVQAPDWAKSHDLCVRCEAALDAIAMIGEFE